MYKIYWTLLFMFIFILYMTVTFTIRFGV